MRIKGSCHCGNAVFRIETDWYYPVMWCYCETCRKCNGSPTSPYIKGLRENLEIIEGSSDLSTYRVRTNERVFCRSCGSSLYLLDSRWPRECWILASAVDSSLPACPEHVHIFVKSKPSWFPIDTPGPQSDDYSNLSIEDWHRKLKLDP